MIISVAPRIDRFGYRAKSVRARATKPMLVAGVISMALDSSTGRASRRTSSVAASIWRTAASASSSRPCMSSQRGLSGRFLRTNRMTKPRTGPNEEGDPPRVAHREVVDDEQGEHRAESAPPQ